MSMLIGDLLVLGFQHSIFIYFAKSDLRTIKKIFGSLDKFIATLIKKILRRQDVKNQQTVSEMIDEKAYKKYWKDMERLKKELYQKETEEEMLCGIPKSEFGYFETNIASMELTNDENSYVNRMQRAYKKKRKGSD